MPSEQQDSLVKSFSQAEGCHFHQIGLRDLAAVPVWDASTDWARKKSALYISLPISFRLLGQPFDKRHAIADAMIVRREWFRLVLHEIGQHASKWVSKPGKILEIRIQAVMHPESKMTEDGAI
jgi:hypothetical protein